MKKFFQDQAPPLFQGLDVHPPPPPTPPHSQFLDPALVVSVMGRESPIFSYANPLVRKIVLFYFISLERFVNLKEKFMHYNTSMNFSFNSTNLSNIIKLN